MVCTDQLMPAICRPPPPLFPSPGTPSSLKQMEVTRQYIDAGWTPLCYRISMSIATLAPKLISAILLHLTPSDSDHFPRELTLKVLIMHLCTSLFHHDLLSPCSAGHHPPTCSAGLRLSPFPPTRSRMPARELWRPAHPQQTQMYLFKEHIATKYQLELREPSPRPPQW